MDIATRLTREREQAASPGPKGIPPGLVPNVFEHYPNYMGCFVESGVTLIARGLRKSQELKSQVLGELRTLVVLMKPFQIQRGKWTRNPVKDQRCRVNVSSRFSRSSCAEYCIEYNMQECLWLSLISTRCTTS
jgi:hypothetical protein